jgi:hypothetical protein
MIDWFMWKIHWLIFKHETYEKYMRLKYCHRGLHKISKAHWEHDKDILEYLQCKYCNWLFFSDYADKIKYLEFQKKSDSALHEAFSRLGSKGTLTPDRLR